jgi:hypothetical protein
MTYAILNMEAAYSELRPLFFGAFGRLARQGFAAAPTDTLDYIHDFFTEAWPGVVRNYDPEKGPFEKYVYVAFVHFVRPRIIDTIHLRNSFIEYEQIIDAAKERFSVEPDFESRIDVQRLNTAMDHLSAFEHALLKHYLSFEAPSERALSRKFELSRYKLRSALISALGNMIVWLDRPYLMSTLDWNVALSVWRDKRSFAGAAKCHGLTVHQIKSSNLRVLKFLSQVLSNYHGGDSLHSRSTHMSTKRIAQSAEALFTEALRSTNDDEALAKVRHHADQILADMASSNQFGPSDEELSGIDDDWLGACYNALAAGKMTEDVAEEFYASADDEESIGKAFSQALMTINREDIRHFNTGLASLPAIGDEEAQELLQTPSAKGAGSHAIPLARIGLTPLSVFYGTEAVSYLIERLMDQKLVRHDNVISLEADDVLVNEEHHDVLTWDLTVDEIRRLSICNRETSIQLYRWLIQVAQYRPYIFAGFKCDPVAECGGVRLSTNEMNFEDLYQRWGFEHAPAAVEGAGSF